MYSNIKLIDPRTGKRKINWTRTAFILMAVIPPVIMWLIFYVYVNLQSFTMGFLHETAADGVQLSFENFRLFFRELGMPNSILVEAFTNTFITFASNIVILIGGFFVSFFLYKKIFLYKFFRTVFFLPTILAGTIVSSFVLQFVSNKGPIVSLMIQLGVKPENYEMIADPGVANIVVIAHHMIFSFASNLILWGGALGRIPESVVESAKLDGIGWFGEAIKITIPMVWPTFALTLLMTFCGLFNATGSVFLLTRGNQGTMTINCWMYLQVFDTDIVKANPNAYNYMSAIGLLLTIISFAITMTIKRFTNKINTDIAY